VHTTARLGWLRYIIIIEIIIKDVRQPSKSLIAFRKAIKKHNDAVISEIKNNGGCCFKLKYIYLPELIPELANIVLSYLDKPYIPFSTFRYVPETYYRNYDEYGLGYLLYQNLLDYYDEYDRDMVIDFNHISEMAKRYFSEHPKRYRDCGGIECYVPRW
jgi:hypothetical protein